MQTVYVNFPTVGAVQEFVERISPLGGQFDFLANGYIIDAKSLMSIFSLDLTGPLALHVENDSKETMQAISRFLVGGQHAESVPLCDMEEMEDLEE